MSNIWEKFEKNIDTQGLINDAKEAAESDGFKDVPVGKYEVEIAKMELGESKKGAPMVKIRFKVLEGEFKGSSIFYNQVVSAGFGLHNANEFMKSLATGVEIEFNSWKQYHDMVLDVAEAADGKLEFVLDFGQNDKGYNTYKIEEVFEV